MRTVEVDGKTYPVKNESVNEGNYTFAIADGMYDLHTIHTLEGRSRANGNSADGGVEVGNRGAFAVAGHGGEICRSIRL